MHGVLFPCCQDPMKPLLSRPAHDRLTIVPRAQSRARRKFLRYFPAGFKDEGYDASERGYKWAAHLRWQDALNQEEYQRLLAASRYQEIAARAIRVETKPEPPRLPHQSNPSGRLIRPKNLCKFSMCSAVGLNSRGSERESPSLTECARTPPCGANLHRRQECDETHRARCARSR